MIRLASSSKMYLLLVAVSAAIACGDEPTSTAAPSPTVADMAVVAGDNQTGEVGQQLADPLVVRVSDARGAPVRNQIVNFRVTDGGGSVYAGVALTDAQGMAREWWTLGDLGENKVEARAVDTGTGDKVVFARFTAEAVKPGSGSQRPDTADVSQPEDPSEETPQPESPRGDEGESEAPKETEEPGAVDEGSGAESGDPASRPQWATGRWLLTLDGRDGELDLNAGTATLPVVGKVPLTIDIDGAQLVARFAAGNVGEGVLSLRHSNGELRGTARAAGETVDVVGRRSAGSGGSVGGGSEEPSTGVSRVTVSPASLTLAVGESRSLSATAVASAGQQVRGSTVQWQTSNSRVATVSTSGAVTARAAGSAVITATVGGVAGRSEVTVTAASTPAPPPSQSAGSYPNRPSGLRVIGAADGSVKASGGSAFGISSFGSWSSSASTGVSVVSDPSNPTGSGSSLRFRWDSGSNSAGSATAGRFDGGPVRELYVMTRIYMESGGWDFGHKFFYIGAATGARNNSSSPTQFYSTRERGDNLRFINQNTGSSVIIDSSDPAPRGNGSNPFARNQWLNIEYYMVAESSPGAGDGRMRIWVNNRLVGSSDNVGWTNRSDSAVGFDGMEWYARANSVTATSHYRLGELYIAGR